MSIEKQAAGTPEDRQGARDPATAEEIEMSDDLLDAVAGGGNPPTDDAARTGSAKAM